MDPMRLMEMLFPIEKSKQRFVPDQDIVNGYNTTFENEQARRAGNTTMDTGKILSMMRPQYTDEFISPESAYSTKEGQYYENIPSGYDVLKGQTIAPEDEVARAVLGISTLNPGYSKIGKLANDWYASKGHPDSGHRAQILAEKAVASGLDPYIVLALAAQEGGWAKIMPEDAPYNYVGWGETDSGGMQKGAGSLEEWADMYLPAIMKQYGGRDKLTDWGGSLKGYGKGSKYSARYNYNDSWALAISRLMGQLEQFRANKYPNMSGSTIDWRLPQLP